MKRDYEIERVAVVGLDGLSWWYFKKIFNSGAMPYTRSIYQKSYKSILESTIPPVTPPSWSSIMTGVNPGKHGIFSFDYIDMRTLKQKLFTALDLMHPRIHEMLAMKDVPSVILNPIPDYPLIPIRKAHVMSHLFFTPKILYFPYNMERFAKMLSLAKEVQKDNSLDSIVRSFKIAEIYRDLIKESAETLDWKLYWVNLNIPDVYLHTRLEVFSNKTLPSEIKLFSEIDRIIKILDYYSDALVIVSDHGFSLYKWRISINDLLVKYNFAKIGKPGEIIREHHELMTRYEHQYIPSKILPFLGLLYHPYFKPIRKMIKKLYSLIKGESPKLVIGVDMHDSEAFMGSRYTHGIYIKRTETIPAILKLLENIPGIKWAKRREDVYSGPYVSRAPQIIVCPDYNEGYFLALNRVYGRIHLRVDVSDHHPDGVFMLHAPPVHTDRTWPRRLPVYFVTPLIMYLLGIPLSSATDSPHLLKNIFRDASDLRFTDEYLKRWKIVRRRTLLRKKMKK